MEEILTPPSDIEFDEDGYAMYMIHPSKEEVEKYGKDDGQWVWVVTNNNADKKFEKGVRLGYFTDEQILLIEDAKDHLRVVDQVFDMAIIHCAEIVFPHIFNYKIDYSDEHAIHKAMYDHKEFDYNLSDIRFRMKDYARDIQDGKRKDKYILSYMRRHIYGWMRDNEYFVKHLNNLTKEQLLRIKMHLIGALVFYQYYNVKENG
jgi:hypothetical protein